MSGREVVDTDNFLPEPQKLLEEIGANEPGNPCDDPGLGRGEELFAKLPIRCGDHTLAVEESPAGPIQGVVRGRHVHPIMRAACRGILATRQSIFYSQHADIHKSCRDSVLRVPSQRSASDHLVPCRETAPFCGKTPTEPPHTITRVAEVAVLPRGVEHRAQAGGPRLRLVFRGYLVCGGRLDRGAPRFQWSRIGFLSSSTRSRTAPEGLSRKGRSVATTAYKVGEAMEHNPAYVKLNDINEEGCLTELAQLIHQPRRNATVRRFQHCGDQQHSRSTEKAKINGTGRELLIEGKEV
jgi:hypothetical protein